MALHTFHLSGFIRRSDNNLGVHGLRVEAWVADKGCDQAAEPAHALGWALTNRDGSYHIDLPGIDDACCDCPAVYVVLRDRDCRLIHDGCADRRCCTPGQPLRVDVTLAPQALWWHLARPLSWERIDEPLLPARVMQEIEDALELLRADGVAADVAALRLAVCATPSIEGFDRVLRDAWGTLQGDLDAARRYREVLDALGGEAGGCCKSDSPFAAEVDRLFAGACDQAPPADCQPPAACEPCGASDCCDGGCNCGAPFLSQHKVLLLLAAALHLACHDEAVAKRHVLTLLDQFCRFATLGALHAASLSALLGDAAGRAHARDLLELLCRRCGSADSRMNCTPRQPPGCAPCLDPELLRCLREAIVQWCRIDCWSICEVRPPRACAGEEILIVGCGFGHRPGQVVFRSQGAGLPSTPQAQVTAWCDDRISVRVPQGAGCGLAIVLPPSTIALCGRFLELRPTGCIESGFEGSAAQILRFDVKDHHAGECPLQPGVPLRIRWNTCAADRVRVELIDLASNTTIAAQDPAEPNGRWDFTATHFTRTTRLRVRITAFGRCQPPQVSRQIDLVFQRHPQLQVQGLEVTQAVQHYRAADHLTDPADRGPDNSLRLVVNKTAWVRTYLRSGQDPAFDNGQLAGVSGTLRVERRVGGVWGVVANIAPQNGPVIAEDSFVSYDAERGNINSTLNFVVPANVMTGLLRFNVDVRGPFAPCTGHVASRSTQVDVNLQQTLNAAFITIGYQGRNADNTGNLDLPAPTLATCQAETSWAMTTYPVSGLVNARIAGTFITETPLDDPRSCDGCCSPNWGPLLDEIEALVDLDVAAHPGEQWVYYGIIAGGIPINVPGCSINATGGVEGAPVTYAHEIGHQFGLPHARCGNAGGGNPAYPVYEPYDLPEDPPATTNWTMASIGEYGLDINNGAIADPATFEDFMSYCGPRWISAFTYQYLTNLPELDPVVLPSGAGAPRVIEDNTPRLVRDETAVAPMIQLLGSIGTDGVVTVARVARLDTAHRRGPGQHTDYIAQHLDAQGRLLSQDPVYSYREQGHGGGGKAGKSGGCGCGCGGDCSKAQPVRFKALLRDVAPGTTLRIVKRGEVVWERKGADKPPKLSGVRASLARNGDLELAWKLAAADKEAAKGAEAEVWVRWSADDGKTWHALAVGLHGGEGRVPAQQLPAGVLRFELLAHDGFHTVRAQTEPLTLPERAPAVTVLYPGAPAAVYGERQIHLWGSASSHGGRSIEADAAEWFINGKSVGRGLDLWVDNPGTGRHMLELVVRDEALEGRAQVSFEVRATDGPPALA